jgi:hypothetical protein
MMAAAPGTDDHDLRLLALLADVRVLDVQEFREVFLNREGRGPAG